MDDSLGTIAIVIAVIAGMYLVVRRNTSTVERFKAQQQVTADLHERSNKLLEREEAVITRVEALLDRLEHRAPQ